MRMTHVAVWTRDLEGAAAFWRRYFGATVGEEYRSGRRPGFGSRMVTLPGDGVRIELMTGPWVGEAEVESAGWDHVAIALGSVEAVEALAARCAADGVLVSGPRRTGDGLYEAVLAMPGGTRVEITA
jgi:lactoylglutathione lyase